MVHRLKILIADDDVDNAQSLGELFELEGHEAVVVYDGEAAVRAYHHHQFDLAFLDVMMPGKNGVESFLEIRKHCPNAKVYMMTGYSVEQLIRQATDNGAMGVLTKPVDLNKISAALKDAGTSGVVVVSENDPNFGNFLVRIVNGGGMACGLVHDQQAARCLMDAKTPDVMIFDLKKPLIDGMEAVTALRKAGRAVPAIIITATAEAHQADQDALHDIRVTGILNKPFDPVLLLDQLQTLAA
ncbi:MAG: response regulator [Alphaproteobacteria bacterium]|nr:response regulator [Alphaproteobacteria bacterium]